MSLFGSLTLVEGLLTIRDPKAMARMTLRDVAMTPSQEEVARKIATIDDAIIARHRTAVRLNARIFDRVRSVDAVRDGGRAVARP